MNFKDDDRSQKFPGTDTGFCPRCGGDGGDTPAAQLTDADAQDNIDEDSKKTVLIEYRGELFCNICLEEYKDEEQAIIDAQKYALADSQRAAMGFTQTID